MDCGWVRGLEAASLKDQETYTAVTPRGRARSRKLKVNDERRVCKAPGCVTVLSKYNSDSLCFVHQPPKKVRIRGRTSTEGKDNMVDVKTRCYACAIRLSGWGQPAEEVEFDGTYHWMVSISGSATKLCEIR